MAKYYAVRVGARTGVFMSWEECQKAVDGFPNAKFKNSALLKKQRNLSLETSNQSKKNLWTDI